MIGNLAENDEEVIRYAGLLRGTESAVQAVSVSGSVRVVSFCSFQLTRVPVRSVKRASDGPSRLHILKLRTVGARDRPKLACDKAVWRRFW